jgi:aspartate aminotransferase
MNHLSNRIEAIEESATLAMAAKAREFKSRGIDVIGLSLGEPDFKTPLHICEAAKKAIDEGKYFAYPPVAGYQDLREALAAKYQKENKVPYKAENIVVSNGAKQSIANAMLALINPGDEVIVFSPYWVSYDALVRLAEGTPVMVKGEIENDFKVSAEQVEKAITKKTKAIIFSSPCNPTGSVFSKTELQDIANVVLRHPGILVIADEIYEHINFTGEQVSIASFPGMIDRTITVNGFAKGFAMTGWRVGYIAAPKWIADGCNKVQGQVTSANCSIARLQTRWWKNIGTEEKLSTIFSGKFQASRPIIRKVLFISFLMLVLTMESPTEVLPLRTATIFVYTCLRRHTFHWFPEALSEMITVFVFLMRPLKKI